MKRKYEEVSKHQNSINQLLTLFFSGVYISSYDMLHIAKALGYEHPSKNRELILKNLFAHCEAENKMTQLMQKLIQLLQKRVKHYKVLSDNYPNICEVSALWIQKANTMIKLLQQHTKVSMYE
jgi:predicted small metal-binding protein